VDPQARAHIFRIRRAGSRALSSDEASRKGCHVPISRLRKLFRSHANRLMVVQQHISTPSSSTPAVVMEHRNWSAVQHRTPRRVSLAILFQASERPPSTLVQLANAHDGPKRPKLAEQICSLPGPRIPHGEKKRGLSGYLYAVRFFLACWLLALWSHSLPLRKNPIVLNPKTTFPIQTFTYSGESNLWRFQVNPDLSHPFPPHVVARAGKKGLHK